MIDAHVLLPSKCDEINYLSEIPAKNGAECKEGRKEVLYFAGVS